jgi:hypothetical protein
MPPLAWFILIPLGALAIVFVVLLTKLVFAMDDEVDQLHSFVTEQARLNGKQAELNVLNEVARRRTHERLSQVEAKLDVTAPSNSLPETPW